MTRFVPTNARKLFKILKQLGFEMIRQKGSLHFGSIRMAGQR